MLFGHVAGIGAQTLTLANHWRDPMLSHHELATLLLIRDTDAPIQTLDSDFLALQRYRLVEMDQAGGDPTLRLTTRGRELLRRLTHDEGGERSI